MPALMHRCWFLGAVGLLMLSTSKSADAQSMHENAPSPVEVRAAPKRVFPTGTVQISGNTLLDAKVRIVTIVVTPPPKALPTTLTATADDRGDFSITFTDTRIFGKYKVLAKSPAGRGSGTTDFYVIQSVEFLSGVLEELRRDKNESRKTLDEVQQRVEQLPPSPPKKELSNRLREVRQQYQDLERTWPAVETAMHAMEEMVKKAPDTQRFLKKSFGEFQKWRSQSEEQHAKNPFAQARLLSCDKIDQVIEGINFAALLMDMAVPGLGIIKNILFDKVLSTALSNLMHVQSAEGQTVISSFLALAGGASSSPFKKDFMETYDRGGTIVALLGNIFKYSFQKLFAAYCQRFRGPFTAHMKADFYQDGKPWWKYSMLLAGTLDIRYPKDVPANATIPVSGEFLGTASGFKAWEDAIQVLFPKSAQGTLMSHFVLPPGAPPYNLGVIDLSAFGKVAVNATPWSFHIPVMGEFYKDKLTLRMKDAVSDVHANARAVYVLLPVFTIGLPVVVWWDLPYKDTHFVFMRVMKGDSLTLNVSVGKDLMTATTTLSSSSGTMDAQGYYDLTMKVCNPDCP